MRFEEEEFRRKKKGFPIIQTVFGTSVMILTVLAVVFITNHERKPNLVFTANSMVQTENQVDGQYSDNKGQKDIPREPKKTAKDLNFWDMYPETNEQDAVEKQADNKKTEGAIAEQEVVEDPATDGKHVQVTLEDGTSTWLALNKSIPLNPYEDTSFQKEAGIMKYYREGQSTSFAGVTLDKYSGTVDFEKLKKAGITFVMIHAGSRGYETGLLTTDEMFDTYMEGATAAGMQIGTYFSSQAVTEDEAVEEANYVIHLLERYAVTYPVGVSLDVIQNDTSRTDGMSKNERGAVLRALISTVDQAGYVPVLMGDKNYLLTRIDLSAFSGVGIWLIKNGNLPEYPYRFGMWQYTEKGQVEGVTSKAKMNISLIDYAAR